MLNRQNQVKFLRIFRKVHKVSGLTLMSFLFIIAISGLMLGWKKNSGGLLLANTVTGTTTNMEKWLPLYILSKSANRFAKDTLHIIPKIDRIDVRPESGVVKYTFKNSMVGIQIDGATARILLVEKRYADIIEQIHDGSIIDKTMGWKSGIFKLIYTSIMSMGLILFCVTGFWLWYGPKILKR